jgi:hypothetical protein
MNRRTIIGGIGGLLVSTALIVAPMPADAAVSINFGFTLPAPPVLVPVPGAPVVTYAPDVRGNFFQYGGQYYVFSNGGWYVGPAYNGPWQVVAREYVPRPILTVPVRYYPAPPVAWKHYRHDAPPRWAHAYGRRWDEHRPDRDGRWHDRNHDGRPDRHK